MCVLNKSNRGISNVLMVMTLLLYASLSQCLDALRLNAFLLLNDLFSADVYTVVDFDVINAIG